VAPNARRKRFLILMFLPFRAAAKRGGAAASL
jgi:hypothetical protein